MARMIGELFSSPFYLLEYTFDVVVAAVRLEAPSEAGSVERGPERPGTVGEERRGGHVVAFLKLAEQLQRRPPVSRRGELDVEDFVDPGFGGGEQSVPLVTESDRRFVDRDVIRTATTSGL